MSLKSLVFAILTGIVLAADICEASAASPATPPQKHWVKPGASGEDFQRDRAACLMQASESAQMSDSRWTIIFVSCLRSQGWILR